jgi:hypothetical protein
MPTNSNKSGARKTKRSKVIDLSKLSEKDFESIAAGKIDKVSDAGLAQLSANYDEGVSEKGEFVRAKKNQSSIKSN